MADPNVFSIFVKEKETPVPDGGGEPQESEQWLSRREGEGELAVDVLQTDDEVIVVSTVAGVRAEDLDLTVAGDMVTIRGERKQNSELPQGSYLYQECFWGPFSRSIILPVEVKSEGVNARMKNGILTVRLPKARRERVRIVPVADGE